MQTRSYVPCSFSVSGVHVLPLLSEMVERSRAAYSPRMRMRRSAPLVSSAPVVTLKPVELPAATFPMRVMAICART